MSSIFERKVTKTRKDSDGDIIALCSDEFWKEVSKREAIDHIELGTYRYIVEWPEKTTEIQVVHGPNGKYLRADRDNTTKNNLDDLPDC